MPRSPGTLPSAYTRPVKVAAGWLGLVLGALAGLYGSSSSSIRARSAARGDTHFDFGGTDRASPGFADCGSALRAFKGLGLLPLGAAALPGVPADAASPIGSY
jgi:hypothetical protein